MTDTVQRRATYMGVKKFINQELSKIDLQGKRSAVYEAVLSCVEVGIRDPTQLDVFGFKGLKDFSYDRLCILLVNILTNAGENYAQQGPYATLVRETFAAVIPEHSEGSQQREMEMLGAMRDLRASLAREASPAPQPTAHPKVQDLQQPRQTRKAARSRSTDSASSTTEPGDDMAWDDGSTTEGSKAQRHRDPKGAITQPKILLDGEKWHHLSALPWTEVRRQLTDQYGSATSAYPHDVGFIMDILSCFFRSLSPEEGTPRPIALGIDRCIYRLEYFQKRATSPKEQGKAAELEARLMQRGLPKHIRASRRATEKHSSKN